MRRMGLSAMPDRDFETDDAAVRRYAAKIQGRTSHHESHPAKLDGSSMKRESPVSKNNSNVAFNGRRLGGVRPRYQLVRLKRQGRCGRIFEIAFESPRATKEEA